MITVAEDVDEVSPDACVVLDVPEEAPGTAFRARAGIPEQVNRNNVGRNADKREGDFMAEVPPSRIKGRFRLSISRPELPSFSTSTQSGSPNSGDRKLVREIETSGSIPAFLDSPGVFLGLFVGREKYTPVGNLDSIPLVR